MVHFSPVVHSARVDCRFVSASIGIVGTGAGAACHSDHHRDRHHRVHDPRPDAADCRGRDRRGPGRCDCQRAPWLRRPGCESGVESGGADRTSALNRSPSRMVDPDLDRWTSCRSQQIEQRLHSEESGPDWEAGTGPGWSRSYGRKPVNLLPTTTRMCVARYHSPTAAASHRCATSGHCAGAGFRTSAWPNSIRLPADVTATADRLTPVRAATGRGTS